MARARTTLQEISRALDLSVGTISKALSDSPEISSITKRRVRAYAKKSNYMPNTFAAGLRKGKTDTVGLVIPNIFGSFFATIFTDIENSLDKNGYKLLTAISNESWVKESRSIKNMGGGYIDGLIFCASEETKNSNDYSHIFALIKQGIPVVGFERIKDFKITDKESFAFHKVSYDLSNNQMNDYKNGSKSETCLTRYKSNENYDLDYYNQCPLKIGLELATLVLTQIQQDNSKLLYNKLTSIN